MDPNGKIIVNNKKLFLLYPPISKTERYSSEIGNAGGEQIPLGIYCLAAYLRENGYRVMVVDAEAEKLTSQAILDQIIGLAIRSPRAWHADTVNVGTWEILVR